MGETLPTCRSKLRRARLTAAALLLLVLLPLAQAQVPANAYSYTRTSSFTYFSAGGGVKNGMLAGETVEPDSAQLCVATTYDYDAKGNKTSATTANCAGASGRALFASRTSLSSYAAPATQSLVVNGTSYSAVAIPAGIFPTSSSNALSHSETQQYDPRFGIVTKLTGPNALDTRWSVDDFGRKTKELRADGTSTVSAYCRITGSGALDNSSNSNSNTASGDPKTCPTPAAGEAPTDAILFVHSEPWSAASAKIGPFTRVYSDRLGREIRSVTESFDGAGQPAARSGALIVKDSVYNVYGAKIIQTQPYFLASGASTTSGSNDVGVSQTDYDALGRPTAVYVADINGSQPSITFGGAAGTVGFGNYGARRAARQSISYDGLATTTLNDKGQSRKDEKNANGQTVRVTDASGAQLAHQHDAFGNLIVTKDALQNNVALSYDIRGRKLSMNDPDSGVWGYCHDALGQLKAQQNPSMRGSNTLATCPDNNDSGLTATAVAGWAVMAYDKLGRMTQRVEPEYSSTWSYDTYANASACGKGIGKLCESSTSNGINRKWVYDSLGRPGSSRTSVTSGPNLASALTYDNNTGRVASQTYPTGLQVGYSYTPRGYLEKLTLATAATVNPLPATAGGTPGASANLAAGSVLWQAQIVNAWAKTEQQAYGNNVIGKAAFDAASGRTTGLSAGAGAATNVLSHNYSWDSLNNLSARIDNNGDAVAGAVTETFVYGDSLNRLTQYTVAAPAIQNLSRSVTLTYNALGMLLNKSDVGNYTYPAQGASAIRPHALQSVTGTTPASFSYDLNGNLQTASNGKYRSLAYTSFNLPDSQSGISGPGGTPKYTWLYDQNHARLKEVRSVVGGTMAGTRTTWNLHPDNQGGLAFEREENAPSSASAANPAVNSNRHYLSAGGQVIGVMVSTGALPTLTSTQTAPTVLSSITLVKLEYWHQDHLGSLAATTDHAGSVTGRYAYDPFGKRRYTNGTYDAFGSVVVDWSAAVNGGTDRGYTGHEHLDDIGLVHMNGRIFDPTLALFLQADPFIQDPTNLQNYHRYAYCYNNPLTCTDPSGYLSLFGHKILPGLFNNKNLKLGLAIAAAWYLGPASLNGGSWTLAIFDSTIANAATAGFVSGAIGSGNIKGALQGAFSAAVFAGVGNVIEGGNFFAGGGTAGTYAGVGGNAAGAVALHAVAGCVTSVAGGGKCGPGALSAAFSEAATINRLQFEGPAGVVSAAVIGGTASVLGGGRFANGAQTAAFAYLFNECAHTRMCGSDSTSIRVTGNRAFGNLAHAEIEISSGYDFVVLEAGPSSTGKLDAVSGIFDRGPNWGSAFSYDLLPPAGENMASIGLELQNAARLYNNNLQYAIPGGFGSLGRVMDFGYNSNSYVGGLIEYVLPGNGIRWGIQEAARLRGFRVPGMEKPIPVGGSR